MKKRINWFGFCFLVSMTVLISAHFGSRAVTAMVEGSSVERKVRIIVDPGHGGVDGGAISCSGISESTYNLQIALKLRDLLHFMGYETVMIRESDVSVYTTGNTIAQKKISDLKERVRIVKDTQNPILLSIHQNYYPDSRYSGPQVFYPKTNGSKELAQQLQDELNESLTSGKRRQTKQASGIYLMEHISCTGVLIECGFLSNPEEEAKLRNDQYQRKVCSVIVCTLGQYLSNT